MRKVCGLLMVAAFTLCVMGCGETPPPAKKPDAKPTTDTKADAPKTDEKKADAPKTDEKKDDAPK